MLGDVLWSPTAATRSGGELRRYIEWVEPRVGRHFEDYESLWQWSVDELATFWSTLWEYFDLGDPVAPTDVLDRHSMPGVRWFVGQQVNYAERVLRRRDAHPAVVSVSETRGREEISYAELAEMVGRAAGGLQALGIRDGDRVVGYLPNALEAIVAFLACASLGAIWSSCPPEFGPKAVLDRFAQLEPKLLIAVDGYRYAGRDIDVFENVQIIRDGLVTLETTVVVDYLKAGGDVPDGACSWEQLCSAAPMVSSHQVEFSHPLWVLYSSGTTGLPKAIVHSHGGILLEHLKCLALHCDMGESDRFFWFSTTGWMMWNLVVSGLLVGATIVVYDGSPSAPDLNRLWELAEAERITWFGTSAPFIAACRKAGIEPAATRDLTSLRFIGSTASPLSPEGFRWVY
jgi:acetoacetyl-CoA synthetase